MTTDTTLFAVQYREDHTDPEGWVDCVREDLYQVEEGIVNADALDIPATFTTRADAQAFIATLCGMMHCGGDPADFRVVTRATVTDEQITRLRDEAAQAGDDAQVDICQRALGRRGGPVALTVDEARYECARVIADATAQEVR
ncbi:MAG: hypothetical protein OEW98_00210 [Betaproteobacteria bacterium]|nr:hypothetical protein [Betaproteobacteria bacterium]